PPSAAKRPAPPVSGDPFPVPSATLKPPAKERSSDPPNREYESHKDDQFEILSLASAPTPAKSPKFDTSRLASQPTPARMPKLEPPRVSQSTHKEPPPDIDAITS